MKKITITKKPTRCRRCNAPSSYLGAASRTCPRCQNLGVAELEADLGLKKGELGRVDEFGNTK